MELQVTRRFIRARGIYGNLLLHQGVYESTRKRND